MQCMQHREYVGYIFFILSVISFADHQQTANVKHTVLAPVCTVPAGPIWFRWTKFHYTAGKITNITVRKNILRVSELDLCQQGCCLQPMVPENAVLSPISVQSKVAPCLNLTPWCNLHSGNICAKWKKKKEFPWPSQEAKNTAISYNGHLGAFVVSGGGCGQNCLSGIWK